MEVVVGVSTGVMKPLLSKLTKLLGEEYVKFKGVRKQIRFLRDELSAMSATLEVLADVEQLNPEVRLWRDKLRELAYDLEDCIDGFMARVDQGHDGHTGFIKKFFRVLKRSKARHEIGNQIEELKACVMEASDMRKRYDSGQLQNNPGMSSVDPRLQVLYEDIENLVGIDGPKKHIIELLTTEMNGSSSKLKVVSIAGCGGLGKTTLAKQVYDTIKVQFSCSAFVSVSRTPDARKILIHISDGVGSTGYTRDDDEQQLIDKLREHLQDERYLIVIDDIWDEKPWEIIKLALVNKNCGSRVIITTRSTAVASRLSSQGGNVYQLKSLSFEDSKRLLFKRAFGSENSSFAHLGSVPDEILKKCDGLPLAIITISSMLADKHAKCEWERVLSDIGSALANNPGAEKMTAILSMSYFDMPHHLRTCLLYLSVFPEDYQIEKRCLINRWTAEGGFIGEEKGLTKYEIGEGYFNDLINRSMIQPVDIMDGQAKACRVHDIILDYIKCRAVEVNFVTILDDDEEHIYASKHKVRRLCVSNRRKELASLLTSSTLSHVRSLMISGFLPVKTSLLPSTALRVLDLGDCYGMNDHHLASIEKLFHLKYLRLHSHSITKLPEKIGELRYLQTLDVRGTSIKELPPTIGELRYLQTLDVRGTSIKELPPTITELQRLAYLYFDNEVRFPDGMIGQMHGLEELGEYGVHTYEQGKSLEEEFCKLTKLRTLKIQQNFDLPDGSEGLSQAKGFDNYVGTLLSSLSSCNLYDLYITEGSNGNTTYPRSLDSWRPAASCSLQKLCMKFYAIYNVPNWMGSLGNLVVLTLDSIICLRPEDVDILGAIPSLLFLELSTTGGSNGRIIIAHRSNGFRCLKYFSMRILYCGTSLEFEARSMPKLEHVKLRFFVHEMECMNGASSLGVQHLSALSKLEVEIHGNCLGDFDLNYDPTEDKNDGPVRYVANAINDAALALPNRPTVRFVTVASEECNNFKCCLREQNQMLGGLATQWLKIWQIEEDQTEQAKDGETEQEDDADEEEQ